MTSVARQIGILLVATAALAAVGWLDFRSGYQIGLFPIYAVPIGWVAWSCGLWQSTGLVILSTYARVLTETRILHLFDHDWAAWERGATRLLLLSFIAYSFNHFRVNIERKSAEARRLEGVLPICPACNRIRDEGGRWIDLEGYLREFSKAEPEPRLCPSCGGRHSLVSQPESLSP
jgi:hypothetical protein